MHLSAGADRAGKSHLTCLAPQEQRKPWADKAGRGFKQSVSKSALYPAKVVFSTGEGDWYEVCKENFPGQTSQQAEGRRR